MDELKNFYFEDSRGKHRLLANNISAEQAQKIMKEFLDDHNFKSYYTIINYAKNGNIIYDVGSHTEFFIFGFMEED